MKTLANPIEVVTTSTFYYGSLSKGTRYIAILGQKFTVIAETEKFYITTNEINNKLPKCYCK